MLAPCTRRVCSVWLQKGGQGRKSCRKVALRSPARPNSRRSHAQQTYRQIASVPVASSSTRAVRPSPSNAVTIRKCVSLKAPKCTVRSARTLASLTNRSGLPPSEALVHEYAELQPQGTSLKKMVAFGKNCTDEDLLQNAKYLYRELPIRFARRARELDNLPYGLSEKEPIRVVRSWYLQSFKDILSRREPETKEEEQEFSDLLEVLINRHRNIVMMAKGIFSLKEDVGESALMECPYLQDFLDRFYMSRIGIRMIMSQHVALHHKHEDFVGIIGQAVSLFDIAEVALADSTRLCERTYGSAPPVEFQGKTDIKFPYVPDHLHYMLLELLKNAMRAVAEHHGEIVDGVVTRDLPAIDIVFAEGKTDVTIKVSDQGGGIPREHMEHIWTYLYTTAEGLQMDKISAAETGWTATSIMAGLGYGLPMCRLFTRYFGGDLEVISLDGIGTDAYLYLNKLGDSEESLPL